MTQTDSIPLLARALDQAGDVLAAVREDQLDAPTPCDDWSVAQLVGHLTALPGQFLAMARNEEVDWSIEPAAPGSGWASGFRSDADDLIHFWHQAGDGSSAGGVPEMPVAEFAVHTWDLARAIGWSRPLDEEVARCGLGFMSSALTPERRGDAFAAERQVPDDASYVDRLAAFAGRQP
ncbi:hypothetical protein ASG90_20160 [Nocardioides sp. Soil797]|nr:hypothetical protein ASG90_20160 [Nocardioides sp. Soil797]